jgi:putative transposase
LKHITDLFQPTTILGWYRNLVAQKYNGAPYRRKSGRPRVSPEIIERVLWLAKRNQSWGYDKIRNTMVYLGFKVSRSTVKRILDDNGITPEPEKQRSVQWNEFLKSHLDVMAATDFLTVELLTKRGLVICMVLFFINISTRKVEIAGIKCGPDGQWMKQIARNVTDSEDGFLKDVRYLIHDRDTLYTKDFDDILKSSGIEIIKTPPCSPNLNPHSEKWVQSLKFECLDKMIFTNQAQLEYAVSEFVTHYHRERPHMALGGKIIDPYPQDPDGDIVEFERLGGLLRSYRRVKKAV